MDNSFLYLCFYINNHNPQKLILLCLHSVSRLDPVISRLTFSETRPFSEDATLLVDYLFPLVD